MVKNEQTKPNIVSDLFWFIVTQNIKLNDNFRKWFGDSKVVDKDGKPMICYHGTPKGGFTEFNGVPTFTCIAVGPDKSEKIDLITGGLPLL